MYVTLLIDGRSALHAVRLRRGAASPTGRHPSGSRRGRWPGASGDRFPKRTQARSCGGPPEAPSGCPPVPPLLPSLAPHRDRHQDRPAPSFTSSPATSLGMVPSEPWVGMPAPRAEGRPAAVPGVASSHERLGGTAVVAACPRAEVPAVRMLRISWDSHSGAAAGAALGERSERGLHLRWRWGWLRGWAARPVWRARELLGGPRIRVGRRFALLGRLKAHGPGRGHFGDDVTVDAVTTPFTHAREARIEIGSGSYVNGTRFGCASLIRIGEGAILGDARLIDTDFHPLHRGRAPRSPRGARRPRPSWWTRTSGSGRGRRSSRACTSARTRWWGSARWWCATSRQGRWWPATPPGRWPAFRGSDAGRGGDSPPPELHPPRVRADRARGARPGGAASSSRPNGTGGLATRWCSAAAWTRDGRSGGWSSTCSTGAATGTLPGLERRTSTSSGASIGPEVERLGPERAGRVEPFGMNFLVRPPASTRWVLRHAVLPELLGAWSAAAGRGSPAGGWSTGTSSARPGSRCSRCLRKSPAPPRVAFQTRVWTQGELGPGDRGAQRGSGGDGPCAPARVRARVHRGAGPHADGPGALAGGGVGRAHPTPGAHALGAGRAGGGLHPRAPPLDGVQVARVPGRLALHRRRAGAQRAAPAAGPRASICSSSRPRRSAWPAARRSSGRGSSREGCDARPGSTGGPRAVRRCGWSGASRRSGPGRPVARSLRRRPVLRPPAPR